MKAALDQAHTEGRLAGQIDLLDDVLNLVFYEDPQLDAIIEHSRKINNEELIETFRELIRNKDLKDVKQMILSL
ncbi:MAG: hypothetical protein JXR88_09010 [Clostridia bacterium]|nr:hypothetical protein [Clostridia bacterium]